MEGNTSKPRVIMVFGAPCSGKTTFAKKMSEKYNLAYYNVDEIIDELNLSPEQFMDVLNLITRTGKTILIEGGIDTEAKRNDLKRLFKKAGYAVGLVWIQTDTATIRARMKARYHSVAKAKEQYALAMGKLEAPTLAEDPIILSGKHTFDTQSKLVLARLADVDRR